jgi:hypothetical protein
MTTDTEGRFNKAIDKLPPDALRWLHKVSSRLRDELNGQARSGTIIALCNENLRVLKYVPHPEEFALVRQDLLALKAKAEADIRMARQ